MYISACVNVCRGRCTTDSDCQLDMKSVYYSVCIAYILQDFAAVNIDHLLSFIKSCSVSSASLFFNGVIFAHDIYVCARQFLS